MRPTALPAMLPVRLSSDGTRNGRPEMPRRTLTKDRMEQGIASQVRRGKCVAEGEWSTPPTLHSIRRVPSV